MAADEEIVTFRLSPRDRAAIARLVEEGEFRNRSDFLRYAVKSTLERQASPPPPRALDLELEGIDLPSQGPPASRGNRARGRRGVNL